MLDAVDFTAVGKYLELAELARNAGSRYAVHQLFGTMTVCDKVFDGNELEAQTVGDNAQFGQAGHGAIGVHDFAQYSCGGQAGQTAQIDHRFGVSGAHQYATGTGLERKGMARSYEITGTVAGICQVAAGEGSFGGGNSGGGSLAGFDGNGECRFKAAGIAGGHHGQAQFFDTCGGNGGAYQATTVGGHEIHMFGLAVFGSADKVAFAFAIFVVGHNDNAAGLEFFQGFFDGIEHQAFGTMPASRR